MIGAIMQPTYLPWSGYFDLIDQADVFVFLDTVAFSRQSWQQRNRISTEQGVKWLTVPVRHRLGTPIREVTIDNSRPWRRKHWSSIEQAYRKAPYWDSYCDPLGETYGREWESLADLNVSLIRLLSGLIGVEVRFELTSALTPSGASREAGLLDLCTRLGIKTYVAPPGSIAYLQSDAEFDAHGIELRFHAFEHPVYPQRDAEFVPYLSVVDLLVNVGPEALAMIRSGRRPALTIEQVRAIAGGRS